MEPKFQSILQNTNRLKAMTGVNREQFNQLLPHFETALYDVMENQTMDGYRREGRRFSPYKNSPLPTSADKLLFILTYLKINPTQEIQGQLFHMGQSTVSKWFHVLHEVLNVALARQGFLPARDSDELELWLQELPPTDPPDEATREAVAPQSADTPLFIKTALNDPSRGP